MMINAGAKRYARSIQVASCPHDPPYVRKCCVHLLAEPDIPERVRFFTGTGTEYHWRCPACADVGAPPLVEICAACDRKIHPGVGDRAPYHGRPAIQEIPTQLRFDHRDVSFNPPLLDLVGLVPVESEADTWLALTRSGQLARIDFSSHRWQPILTLERTDGALFGEDGYPEAIAMHVRLADMAASQPPSSKLTGVPASQRLVIRDRATRLPNLLVASAAGRYVAVCNRWGERGIVLDLETGRPCFELKRNYHAEQSDFPVAFAESALGPLLIHGTAWNRLDVTQMSNLKLLTPRESPAYNKGEPSPHYLDYFHGGLSVSPGGNWILDNGWVWHPVGVVATWRLTSWIDGDVWESEDGPSKRRLCFRDYLWDAPCAWIDDQTVAVWGIGDDDEWMLDAARIFDVRSGDEIRWFPGPAGNLVFDRYLFSFGESLGTAVWDVRTGERLLKDEETRPIAYHPTGHSFLSAVEGGFRVSRLVGTT